MSTQDTSKTTAPSARRSRQHIPGTCELKESTLRTYEVIFDRYMRNALQKRQVNPDEPVQIDSMDLVEDWLGLIGRCRPRTSNLQRSALLWAFVTKQDKGWKEAHARLSEIPQQNLRIANVHHVDSEKRSRTPGRMLPEIHLHALLNALADRGDLGAKTQWFLLAGVASGARPIEWMHAKWVDPEETILRIYTAKSKKRNAWDKIPPMTFISDDMNDDVGKNSDGDTDGDGTQWERVDFERRLKLLDLTDAERKELRKSRYRNGVMLFRDVFIEPQYRTYVKLHVQAVKNCIEVEKKYSEDHGIDISIEDIFQRYYYNPVRHCILRACRIAFSDGTLYSLADTRSTFSANRKAQFGLAGAAKDLGHQGVTTARDYYAPASKAWTKYKPQPGQKNTVQQSTNQPAPSAAASASPGMGTSLAG